MRRCIDFHCPCILRVNGIEWSFPRINCCLLLQLMKQITVWNGCRTLHDLNYDFMDINKIWAYYCYFALMLITWKMVISWRVFVHLGVLLVSVSISMFFDIIGVCAMQCFRKSSDSNSVAQFLFLPILLSCLLLSNFGHILVSSCLFGHSSCQFLSACIFWNHWLCTMQC